MTRCAGSYGRRENKYCRAEVSQHCNDFADDVEEFPALRKSSTVNVDFHALSGPLRRFNDSANHHARHHPQGSIINMAEIYIPTEQYRAAVNAIAALTGTDTDADAVKITLGEEGNIWPASIKPDAD